MKKREHSDLTRDELAERVTAGDESILDDCLRFGGQGLRGTRAWWASRRAEAHSWLYFLEHKFDIMPILFHTESAADLHWPHLHRLISEVSSAEPSGDGGEPPVTANTNGEESEQRRERKKMAKRQKDIIDHPHITAHYFVKFMELLNDKVWYPVYNCVEHILRYEFAQRGMTHGHSMSVIEGQPTISQMEVALEKSMQAIEADPHAQVESIPEVKEILDWVRENLPVNSWLPRRLWPDRPAVEGPPHVPKNTPLQMKLGDMLEHLDPNELDVGFASDSDQIKSRTNVHKCTAYCLSATAGVDGGECVCRFGYPLLSQTCMCESRNEDRPPAQREVSTADEARTEVDQSSGRHSQDRAVEQDPEDRRWTVSLIEQELQQEHDLGVGELISRVAGECTELEEYAILHYLKRLGDQNLIKFKDDASEESDKEPEGEEVAQLVAQALQGEGSAGLTIDEVICRVCKALGLEPEGHSSAIEEENFAEFDDMDVDLVGDVMAGVEGVHARETFYEIQPEGTLTCAMHAAHNVVGSAADPALDFTSFVKAAKAEGRPEGARHHMWGTPELLSCFGGRLVLQDPGNGASSHIQQSLQYAIMQIAYNTFTDVDDLAQYMQFASTHIQGFIVHETGGPGHWVALRCLHSRMGCHYQHVDSLSGGLGAMCTVMQAAHHIFTQRQGGEHGDEHVFIVTSRTRDTRFTLGTWRRNRANLTNPLFQEARFVGATTVERPGGTAAPHKRAFQDMANNNPVELISIVRKALRLKPKGMEIGIGGSSELIMQGVEGAIDANTVELFGTENEVRIRAIPLERTEKYITKDTRISWANASPRDEPVGPPISSTHPSSDREAMADNGTSEGRDARNRTTCTEGDCTVGSRGEVPCMGCQYRLNYNPVKKRFTLLCPRNHPNVSPTLSHIITAVRANSDAQIVLDQEALLMYIIKYQMKVPSFSSCMIGLVMCLKLDPPRLKRAAQAFVRASKQI